MTLEVGDARRFAPATERNRQPILAILSQELPESGLVLEVASGTGEHAVHFARALPGLVWQPSDPSPDALRSIAAWSADAGLGNVLPPIVLDATAAVWPIARADALVCINMVHISPWAATEGLMQGAGRLLGAGSPLCLYGPYRRSGHETAPSNADFDRDLRSRNPDWGLRDLEAVANVAEAQGLRLARIVDMPANNLTMVFRKA